VTEFVGDDGLENGERLPAGLVLMGLGIQRIYQYVHGSSPPGTVPKKEVITRTYIHNATLSVSPEVIMSHMEISGKNANILAAFS